MNTRLDVRLLTIACGALAPLVLASCRGSPRVTPVPVEPTPPCLIAPMGAVADTLTVALLDNVDPGHAPFPRNISERMVFRFLYEPLIRLDCRGEAYGALAISWGRDDDEGRRWRFVLREHARFWNGAAVSPTDVISSWVGGADHGRVVPWVRRLYQEAALVSDRMLAIRLPHVSRDPPATFAHPGLAVARPSPRSAWPEGTGPYRVIGGDDTIVLQPIDEPDLPVLRFRVAPDADPRDLLDGRVALLVTRDPAAIDYAATLPGYRSHALAWDRTYLLASDRFLEGSRRYLPDLQRLTDDAVRADARTARPLSWLEARCELDVGPESGPRFRPTSQPLRIVYPEGDPIARDLAERLVALAGRAPDRPDAEDPILSSLLRLADERQPIAAGLDPEAYADALRWGADAAYVLGLSRKAYSPCNQLEELLRSAPWLARSARLQGSATMTEVRLDRRLLPLIDVRPHAVLARNLHGVRIDWDGTPFLVGTPGPP